MKLNDLSIGSRLHGGFGAAFFLLATALAILVFRQWVMLDETRLLTGPVIERYALANSLKEANLENIIRFMAVISEHDKARQNEALDAIKEQSKRNALVVKRLEELARDDEAKAALKAIDPSRLAFVAERSVALKLAVEEGKHDEALIAWRKAGGSMQVYRNALDEYKRIQSEAMDKAGKDVEAGFVTTRNQAMFIGLAALGLFVLLARITANSITRPVDSALTTAQAIAGGQLDGEINVTGKDELSRLLQAMKVMQDNLVVIVRKVRAGAEEVATASQEVARATQDLSQRTEEHASSLEETAASMEELTSAVKGNTESARQANQLAQDASTKAAKGSESVQQVVSSMSDITRGAKRISDIIALIDGVAFQTNILALNAAVEAARAGEHGRGFAVVAAEVRSLAQRSAQSAKEIKQLIAESTQSIENGASNVNAAGAAIEQLVGDVAMVGQLMGGIAAASAEQSTGIEQVNITVSQMDSVIQQNAAVVEESAAAAEAMRMQAIALLDAVSELVLEGDGRGAPLRGPRIQASDNRVGLSRRLTHPGRDMTSLPANNKRKVPLPANADEAEWAEF